MRGSPTEARTAFAEDLDEDLVSYMAMREVDEPSAQQAGAEFYDRHKRFLFSLFKKRKLDRLVGGDDMLGDLVQETFARAWKSAGTYRACGKQDGDLQRRACRNWLVGIAKNILRDALTRPISIVPEASYDDAIGLLIDREASPDDESEAARIVADVIESMDEREQDVLRTTMMYYKIGEDNQRLPNGAMESLATIWSTTSENIRAIRMRAYRKIKKAVETKLQGKQEAKR